jgi:hypothetical protein
MSYMFEGTVEQSFVAHAMAYSACIGPYNNTDCLQQRGFVDSFVSSGCHFLTYQNKFLLVFLLIVLSGLCQNF